MIRSRGERVMIRLSFNAGRFDLLTTLERCAYDKSNTVIQWFS
jgi:hypothetical protein